MDKDDAIEAARAVERGEAPSGSIIFALTGPNSLASPGPDPEPEPNNDDAPLRLVIEVDARLLDPTWTQQDLIDNAVLFFQDAIDRAEREGNRAFPNPAYTIDTSDITLWTKPDYLKDLIEGEVPQK